MITAIDLGYSTVKILQLTVGSSGYTVLNSGSKSIIDNLKSFDPEKTHIKIIINSPKLKKMAKIKAHKEIFSLLKNEMKDKIHALEIEIK